MSAADLFWSEQGAIGCARHVPYPGSDTWRSERWQAMTPTDRLEFAKTLGHPAACECCPNSEHAAVFS